MPEKLEIIETHTEFAHICGYEACYRAAVVVWSSDLGGGIARIQSMCHSLHMTHVTVQIIWIQGIEDLPNYLQVHFSLRYEMHGQHHVTYCRDEAFRESSGLAWNWAWRDAWIMLLVDLNTNESRAALTLSNRRHLRSFDSDESSVWAPTQVAHSFARIN